MAHKHGVCDACAADIFVGAWELPLVGETGEGSVGAAHERSRVAYLAYVGAVGSNDLHLLDPSVRGDSLQESKTENSGHLDGGHHVERHEGHGGGESSGVVC